ncbi:MAG: protein kinase [Deltaproteobacteria bacterium]|nr:protein kinase [Deltaproteobacteria bacterium]MDQ3298795.1 protein kinase [Myxococcota bacterium]
MESALFCPNCGRPKVREAIHDGLLGKVLGERFLVQQLIGQGASGTIYRAEHVTLRRKVAIKVLHTELSRDDLAVERFRREATTVAEIDNEHIVEIHDFGRTPDGRLYLAMELLEGETLDHVLAREKQLSIERAADVLIQVGEALMEAHAIGYVHRDLRPRNVYLAIRRGKANFIKLLDFGLAKLVETDSSAASTSLGMTFGDPRYMSPEQARGDRIDRRADIYQLGCVAYEMLTGAPPFSGSRVFDILTKQVSEAPVPLPTRRPGVPLWMEAAVAKMLAKDPENRFATTTRMVEALRRGLETGEVMDDEVARRRESVPPPSVSRVMQRMGFTEPQDPPLPASLAAPAAELPSMPASPVAKPAETDRALPPVPEARPPVADSVELLRKRTGTPRVGVPVVGGVARSDDPAQAPVAGIIEPPRVATQDEPRGKRPTTPPRAVDPGSGPGISQVWYEEGERSEQDDELVAPRAKRANKQISPSVTDLSLYDEVPRRRGGWLILAVLGLATIGGVAFALTRGDDSTSAPTPSGPITHAGVTIDAAPSTVLDETADAAVAQVRPDAAATARKPDDRRGPTSGTGTSGTSARKPSGGGGNNDIGSFVPGGGDPTFRRPGGGGPFTMPTPTTPTVKDPDPKTPTGVSGTDGPIDPYGGSTPDPTTDTPPTDGAAPEKKAEFFANLGAQQLASGDASNAAASFRKALDLDPRNPAATIGMGEIALRQGLFGDAIVHLKKAVRLAPRSARVFTLLGEAYLRSGNNNDAAASFKKALQLDPDNTRAREGYNEASSRVPPPTDD